MRHFFNRKARKIAALRRKAAVCHDAYMSCVGTGLEDDWKRLLDEYLFQINMLENGA